MPREWPVAEQLPLFLKYLGLQIDLRNFARFARRTIQAQIERDAEGGFGGAYQPTRKYVLLRGTCCNEVDLVRANPHVCDRPRKRLCDPQLTAPVERFDDVFGNRPRARKILAAGQARHF